MLKKMIPHAGGGWEAGGEAGADCSLAMGALVRAVFECVTAMC